MNPWHRRGTTITVLVILQVMVLVVASAAAVKDWIARPIGGDEYVLLVMGSDQGPYRSGDVFDGRSDTTQLLVVDQSRKHVSILSFPRDSYVPVRGRGRTKINEMLQGGPDAAVGTIEDLTGLKVDDWIVTTFKGLTNGVEAFGGVPVHVQHHLTNTSTGSGSDRVVLKPGRQRLNGAQALGFARDRKSRPGGDFGRSEAGGQLLRALHKELRRSADSPVALARIAATLQQHTATSISPDRLIRLGVTAVRINPKNVTQKTVPGSAGWAGSASVVYLGGGAEGLFADLRDDGRLNDS